eukprot:202748_1
MPAITVSDETHFQYNHSSQSTSSQSASPLSPSLSRSLSTSYHPENVQLNHKWDNRYDLSMEEFLRYLPKVELHVHLDGAMDPLFLWDYLKRRSSGSSSSTGSGESGRYLECECLPEEVTLPWNNQTLKVRSAVEACTTLQQFTTLVTCRGKRSLFAMLECFEIFVPIVRGNVVLLEQLAYDFCQRQFSQCVIYTEVRYSPHFLASEEEEEKGDGDDSDDNNDDNSDGNGEDTSTSTNTSKKRKRKDTGARASARDVIDAITRG